MSYLATVEVAAKGDLLFVMRFCFWCCCFVVVFVTVVVVIIVFVVSS